MRARLFSRYVPILVTFAVSSCAEPEPVEHSAAQTDPGRASTERTKLALLERAKLAQSGRFLAQPTNLAVAALTTAQGQALVDSLDIPAGLQPTFVTAVSPDPDATTVRTSYGIMRPTGGGSFLMLSTGRSGNETITAEPGTDLPPSGTDGDVSTLQFRVTVPPGVNRMSFDYAFLSAESPDFVGSPFNDTFTATITDALGTNRVIATASVNTAVFHPASDTTVGPCPFQLYVDNPAGVNTVFNQPGFAEVDAGTTGLQRVNVPVASGQATITFDIRDLGDGFFDSAVIIDNVQFSALEVVDPHSGLIDTFLGQVFHTPDPRLASGGTPVRAAAADGVTEVLLRSNVPGPGTAVFSVTSGAATDGSLSGDDRSPVWGPTATTDAVLINGKWYVFALYRSPPDFNRSGDPADPTDTTADKRSAALSVVFTPTVGAPFQQDATIDIVRPPVVVVPEIWQSCVGWTDTNGILAPHPSDLSLQHFTVSCVDYQTSSSKSFADLDNRAAIPEAIAQALQKLRDAGVAVTRADVIGHGMGGLLARRYIDEHSFISFDNFNAGTINRLITVNTPHLGSRLADEFIRTRDAIKQRDLLNGTQNWQNTKMNLAMAGIFFDDADQDLALQQMGANSSVLNNIATDQATASNVFYHALVSTDGHNILRNTALNLLPTGIKNFIITMENTHPSTISLPPGPSRQKLVYSPSNPTTNSIIFCNDNPTLDFNQHDLFATTWEQTGGLDSQFTSPIPVSTAVANNNTAHFKVTNDPAHTSRLVTLLNSSVSGGLFATSMPSPGTVPRKNTCPILPALSLASPTQGETALALAQQTISITSPTQGATVTPGGSISVTVGTNGGAQPLAVLITSLASSELVEAAPFTASVLIPTDALGTTPVSAIAFYEGGGMAFAAPVALNVNVNATVTAIEVLNGDQVLQRQGRTRQLTVIGTYSDGIRRNITQAALGTRYTISQLGPVATVSANGLITAVGPGDATIAITNGAAIASVNVKVGEPACGDGVLDPGEECDDGNMADKDGCDPTCHNENAPPVAVCTSPTQCNDPGLCSANIANLGAGSSDPNGDALSITQSPAGPYSVGSHLVSVDVSDGALDATCTAHVDVLDCERPTLSCPADFTAECTAAGAATITPPPAVASDNCSVTVQAPTPGPLPLGTNQIAYTASDPSSNVASCTTTVTVQDTTPPAIACPAPIVAECTADRSATVNVPNATASDTCGGVVVTGPAGPASYPLGTSTLGFLTTDGSGNPASCTTTVTVADTKAPVFDPATLAPQIVAGHCDDTPVSFTPPRALDCQSVSVTCTPIAGNSLGANTSTCTATDADGRQTTASITVNVLAPLHFQIQAPLWDDNDPDDIETDGDSTNLFIIGDSITNQVKVLNCACDDVTSSIAGSVTARLTVRYRDDADPGTSTSIVPASTGVGGPNGALVLKDGYFEYDQATNPTDYPSGSWDNSHYFQNVLSLTYDIAPNVVVGQEDVRIESE